MLEQTPLCFYTIAGWYSFLCNHVTMEMTLTDFAIVDSGVDTWSEHLTFASVHIEKILLTDHGAQGCRNISITPRGHLSFVGFKTFKRVDMRLVDMEIAPAASPCCRGPQTAALSSYVGRRKFLMWRPCDKRWCKGHLRLQAGWVLPVLWVVLLLKQSRMTEMEAGFPMTYEKRWKCGLILLGKNLSRLNSSLLVGPWYCM